MQDMKQKIILGCLAVVLLIGVIIGVTQCGNTQTGNPNTTETEESIEEGGTEVDGDRILTKGEWLKGLASTFGMTEYTTETPFFTDIVSSDELYAMAQSGAEWGIFEETGIAFEADTEVTREFVVASAIIAAEAVEAESGAQFPTYEACIAYAAEQKVITGTEESYLAESMTTNDAQKILDWALDTYMNPVIEEHEYVVFQDNVVNLMEYTDAVTFQNGIVTIATSITETVNAGDVILTPATADEPFGMALKAVGVSADAEGNRIITTEQATIDDVYKEFDIAGYAIPTKDNLILGEGITLMPDDTPMVEQMSAETEQGEAEEEIQGFHGAFSVNYSSEGKYTVTKEWGDSKIQFGEEIVYKLEEGEKSPEEVMDIYTISNVYFLNGEITPTESKFEGGYEITGTVAIKNLYITVEVEKKTGDAVNETELQKLELQVHCEAESSLTVNGEFASKFLLTKKPIPVYAKAGVGVYAELFIYIDGNGEISVTLGNELHTKVQYENNRIKKTAECAATLATQCNASIEKGSELSLDARIFNIRLWCVEVRLGEQLDFAANLELKTSEEETDEATIVKNEYTWHSALYGTYPEIKLSTGGDNCWIKGGQGSWELIGSDGVIKKIGRKTIFRKSFYLGYKYEEPDSMEEFIWDTKYGKVKVRYNPDKVGRITHYSKYNDDDTMCLDFLNGEDCAFTIVKGGVSAAYKNAKKHFDEFLPVKTKDRFEEDGWGSWYEEDGEEHYYESFETILEKEISNLKSLITKHNMKLYFYARMYTISQYYITEETNGFELYQQNWEMWLDVYGLTEGTGVTSYYDIFYFVDMGNYYIEVDKTFSETSHSEMDMQEEVLLVEAIMEEVEFEFVD